MEEVMLSALTGSRVGEESPFAGSSVSEYKCDRSDEGSAAHHMVLLGGSTQGGALC